MRSKRCSICKTENPIAARFCRHCGHPFSEESKKGVELAPKIKDFIVIEDFYTIGSVVNLIWDVENYTSVSLNGECVTNRDSFEYIISGDATLELIATNDYAQDIRRLKISPNPKPKILRFEANRRKIKEGDEIKIYWEYKNTDIAIIRSNLKREEIHLIAKRTILYRPKVNEILTLVCYSRDKKVYVEQDLELTILDTVAIDFFSASSLCVIESMPITLRWNVRNADSLILYPEGLNVLGKSSITVQPTRSTVYRLVAANELSENTEMLAVGVKPLPKLNYSMPDCSTILNFPSIKLDMSDMISNIDEIRIDKWMMSPNTARRESKIMKFLHRILK